MEEIQIKYDTYYDNWLAEIRENLNKRDIVYDDQLPINICNSLKEQVKLYLEKLGYKPTRYFSYRKGLVGRLKSRGLSLQIVSNRLLWIYLEYFTDIKDYSKCFDIDIILDDETKIDLVKNKDYDKLSATKYIPIRSHDYALIEEKINWIRSQNKYPLTRMELLDGILDILEDLNKKGE